MDLDAAVAIAEDLLHEWGGIPEIARQTVDVLVGMAPMIAGQVDLTILLPAAVLAPTVGMVRCPVEGSNAITLDDLEAAGVPRQVLNLLACLTPEPWQTVLEFEDDLMDGPHAARVLMAARTVAETWLDREAARTQRAWA